MGKHQSGALRAMIAGMPVALSSPAIAGMVLINQVNLCGVARQTRLLCDTSKKVVAGMLWLFSHTLM
jgi:hypothetical protein